MAKRSTGVEPEALEQLAENRKDSLVYEKSVAVSLKYLVAIDAIYTVDSSCFRLLGKIFSSSFVERLENRIGFLEVIVDDIDQVRCFHEIRNQLLRRGVVFVKFSPLCTKLKGLVLPSHETDGFDNGRLHDFFARENTPCHSVGSIGVRVGAQITALVNHIICDVAVSFNLSQEKCKEARIDKKFKICLLIDITVARTPAKHFVVASSTVDSRLRVDC